MELAKKDWNEQLQDIQKNSSKSKKKLIFSFKFYIKLENKIREKDSSLKIENNFKKEMTKTYFNRSPEKHENKKERTERSQSANNFGRVRNNKSSTGRINSSQQKSSSKTKFQKINNKTKSGKFDLNNLKLYDCESEDENQIKMINNPFQVKINSTKVEDKEIAPSSRLINVNKSNFILDDDLNEKLRSLEKKLLGKEKNYEDEKNIRIPDQEEDEDEDEEEYFIKKSRTLDNNKDYNKITAKDNAKFDNTNFNYSGENILKINIKNDPKKEYLIDQDQNEDIIEDVNKDLMSKFNNLSDLEESMKKLNQILDFSSKSSLKFKLQKDDEDSQSDNYEKIIIKDNRREKDNQFKSSKNERKFETAVLINERLVDEINNELDYKTNSIPQPISSPQKIDVKYPRTTNNKTQNTPTNLNISYKPPHTKSIEISKTRKVIDFENSKNLSYNTHTNNNFMQEEEEENLDYLKDLLLKTQADLNSIKNNFLSDDPHKTNNLNSFSSFSNQNSNLSYLANKTAYNYQKIKEDELEPRAPPMSYTGYKKIN